MMVAFGRILRHYVIILVVWLGRITANPQESFKLFRDIHDVFSNSECLPAGVSSGSSTCSSQSCSKFDAKCKLDTKKNLDCSYCVCNKGGRNTYMEDGNGKGCVMDKDIAGNLDCYKFGSRTYLQFFSHDECSGSCYYNFTNNRRTTCNIDWSKSKYLRRGKDWNSVTGANTYFTVTRLTKQRLTKILKVKDKAFNIWNGSLIKLGIKCGRQGKQKGCVLLKFESLPKYSQVTPTSSTLPPSSSTKPTTKHHTTLSSKSEGLSIESSSTKAIAISVPIILVIIILCLVLGFFFIRMKIKRREPELTRNEEEMQSRETPNSPTNVYEDPSQMYESLKEDRREPEQPYQGLVGLDSQGNDTSVYDYIDEKDITDPGVDAEGEYSYASNNNLARPFTASKPPPSAPVVYHEEPETSNRLTDKDEDSKKEHFDQQLMNNHVYQTLEEEEAVENPKLNLGDELSDQSLDSAAEEQIDQPSQNPVNQMLENDPNTGQDASSEAFGCPSVGDVPANDPVQHDVLDNPLKST